MNEEKIIIIGGGVGPLAGVKLHEYIIENTQTNGTDQDHFDIYHLSRSGDIVDRTEALASGTPEVPAEGMFRTFMIAEAALRAAGRRGVGGIPCNTFHTPSIFNHFHDLLRNEDSSVQLVNMIDETAVFIQNKFSFTRKIGILSTTGTRNAQVYNKIFEPKDFSIIQIPEEEQKELHEAIYNREWGIKATSKIDIRVRKRFEKYLHILVNQGAEAVILGCTEIPLALPEKELFGIPLIDPMVALARALIREANSRKLKKL